VAVPKLKAICVNRKLEDAQPIATYLNFGVCARAPVIVPSAAMVAVLRVVKSRLRRFVE
jgi:hypothetical protein